MPTPKDPNSDEPSLSMSRTVNDTSRPTANATPKRLQNATTASEHALMVQQNMRRVSMDTMKISEDRKEILDEHRQMKAALAALATDQDEEESDAGTKYRRNVRNLLYVRSTVARQNAEVHLADINAGAASKEESEDSARTEADGGLKLTAEYWALRLQNTENDVTVEELREMHSIMAMHVAEPEWMVTFKDRLGLEALLLRLAGTQVIGKKSLRDRMNLVIIRCFEVIMCNEDMIQQLTNSPGFVSDIVMAMDIPDTLARSKVLQMLTFIVSVSENGFKKVMEGFDTYSTKNFGMKRFQVLVNFMTVEKRINGANIDLVLDSLTLINVLLLEAPSLEKRVAIRSDLLLLKFDQLTIDLREKVLAFPATDDRRGELLEGIDEYLSGHFEDRNQTTLNEIDFSDAEAVFAHLISLCRDNNTQSYLLGILHLLVTIPLERSEAQATWGKICYIVEHATTEDSNGSFMTYEELFALLKEREAGESSNRADELQEENLRLKEELEAARLAANNATRNVDPTTPPDEKEQKIKILQSQVDQLKQELEVLKQAQSQIKSNEILAAQPAPDAAAIPPAPPIDGSAPSAPPLNAPAVALPSVPEPPGKLHGRCMLLSEWTD